MRYAAPNNLCQPNLQLREVMLSFVRIDGVPVRMPERIYEMHANLSKKIHTYTRPCWFKSNALSEVAKAAAETGCFDEQRAKVPRIWQLSLLLILTPNARLRWSSRTRSFPPGKSKSDIRALLVGPGNTQIRLHRRIPYLTRKTCGYRCDGNKLLYSPALL